MHFLIRIQTEMSRWKKWRWLACKDLFPRNNDNSDCLTSILLFFVFFFLFREFHREQMSIEHSMQDLDSAVGKLDDILMTLYVIIAILIIAIALVTHSLLMFSVWLVHAFFFFRRLS